LGWLDRQLTDGTVIWTIPGAQTYTTYPGSRLPFPTLCEPTAPVGASGVVAVEPIRGLTMPRRNHPSLKPRETHRRRPQIQ